MIKAAIVPRNLQPSFAALSALAMLAGTPAAAGGEVAEAETSKAVEPPAKMPPLPPAQIDEALAVGGQAIDARKLATRMTVAVRINDSGPYRFVVDSGADTSVVGQRIAAALTLPAGEPTMLNGITDTQLVNRVMVDHLQLGPTEFYNLEVPVLRENDIGAEGMIGLDALVEQRLMLDFEKRTISVDDALTPAVGLDGEIVVRARLQRGQLILTQVKANGTPIDAVVDTGSEITIGNTALRDKLVRSGHRFETVEVAGVTGTVIPLQVARVDELKLGTVVLRNVPIAFADIPPFTVFGIDKQPSLLLGTDVMEVFRKVQLDFRARKVRFQLRKCDNNAVRLSTSTNYATHLWAESASGCAR